MNARDVIIRPVVTESSMDAMSDKKYTFDVALDANKVLVRQAVEEEYQKHYNDYFDKEGRVYPLKKLTDTHYVAMKGGEA